MIILASVALLRVPAIYFDFVSCRIFMIYKPKALSERPEGLSRLFWQ
jgi:hypothetical protein